jgi:hypothetical protein
MQIFDNQYFSNITYYKILLNNRKPVIGSNLMYQKGWFGNKCSIIGANGIINLSIPLQGGRNQKAINKDVKIAYEQNWVAQHLKTIKSCYGNAPYFNHYYPIIEKLLLKKQEYLFELNIESTETILKLLKAEVRKIAISEISPSNIEVIFSKQHIQNNPHFWNTNIHYSQVFEDRLGFVANLSIIDLLMCMGPQSREILLQ